MRNNCKSLFNSQTGTTLWHPDQQGARNRGLIGDILPQVSGYRRRLVKLGFHGGSQLPA